MAAKYEFPGKKNVPLISRFLETQDAKKKWEVDDKRKKHGGSN
jgi:hypothetical protein